jgi:Sec-independent protein translocase protein TatA
MRFHHATYCERVPPGLSPVHIVVVLVVALIVLGPEKLPEVARKGATLLVEARQWQARISDELQSAMSGTFERPESGPAPPAIEGHDK